MRGIDLTSESYLIRPVSYFELVSLMTYFVPDQVLDDKSRHSDVSSDLQNKEIVVETVPLGEIRAP